MMSTLIIKTVIGQTTSFPTVRFFAFLVTGGNMHNSSSKTMVTVGTLRSANKINQYSFIESFYIAKVFLRLELPCEKD